MNLYAINDELNTLVQNLELNQETGEINPEFIGKLEQLKIGKKDKALNCGRAIKNLEAEENAIANEMNSLKERKNRLTKKIDAIRQYLMATIPNERYSDSTCEIRWSKSTRLEILDQKLVPDIYIKTTITIAPLKEAIKRDIKQGCNVPGAKLVEHQNLQIK